MNDPQTKTDSIEGQSRLTEGFGVTGRRVVCAAVQYPYGITLVGPRHFDSVMVEQYHRFFTRGTAPGEAEGVQGFLDQRGEFMTREEAHKIATESGQIIRRCGGDEGCLFSENLY